MILPFASQRAQAAAFDPQTGQENLSLRFWNDEKPDNGFYLNATARHMLETVKELSFGTGAGEWTVMDLARGMYTGYDYLNYIPANYFTDYKARIDATVDSLDGELHTTKSTEWSRLTLAMSALANAAACARCDANGKIIASVKTNATTLSHSCFPNFI